MKRLTSNIFGYLFQDLISAQVAQKLKEAPEGINQENEMTALLDARDGTADEMLIECGIAHDGRAHARAKRWLDEMIKEGKKRRFGVEALLTPELAALLLAMNPDNRVLTRSTVTAYARDIEQDRFPLNGEPLIISKEGYMNDGQHRSMAVIEAKKPIKTMIVFGVDRETRTTVDEGRSRTAGDYYSMEGGVDANNVAATASKVMQILNSGKLCTHPNDKPTKQEVLEFLRDNEDAILESVRQVVGKGVSKLGGKSLLAAAHCVMTNVDRDDADTYISKLINGDNLSARSPILAVREKLIDPSKRLTQNEKLKAIFMGWNNYRNGRSVRNVTHSLKKHEKLPVLQ